MKGGPYLMNKIKSNSDSPHCPASEDDGDFDSIRRMSDLKQLGQFISDATVIKKSAEKSCEFRTKGNLFFISTKGSSLDKAVEQYTKSVAHAPTGSQELALAYANRSAVLFKARLISDCLLDIERALKNNYPDNLKAKLYLRKAMCLQILNSKNDSTIKTAFAEARKWTKKMNEKNQKIMEKMLVEQEKVTSIDKSTFSKWDYKEFLPKLSSENPMIPGLSDAVELQYSKKYGRHMVATRDIKPGEVIAVQKIYSAVFSLTSNSRYILCWSCGQQTWASIPCEKCVDVVFCSEICREKAMLEHHEIECPVIASMIALDCGGAELIPLRLIVKALKEMNYSFKTWRKCTEEIDAEKNPLLKGFTNNILEPNKFSSIYGLLDHTKTESMETETRVSIIITFLLATKTQFFGSIMNDDLETLSSKENFIFVVALHKKLIKLSRYNVFATYVKGYEGFRVIVPALCFFNHSCDPMVACRDYDDCLVNKTLRPIKKGQQIFDCYGPNYETMSKNERQAHLSFWYNFLCDCEACKNDWPKVGLANHGIPNDMVIPQYMDEVPLERNLCNKTTTVKAQKNADFDKKEDVDPGATLGSSYRLDHAPYSFKNLMAQSALKFLMQMTRNRFLSLD